MTRHRLTLSRRRWLMGVAAGAVAVAARGGAEAGEIDDGPAALAPRLRGLLGHPDSAGAIGAAYLAAHPEEASPRRLAAAMASDCGASPGVLARWEDGRLRRAVGAAVRRDFAAGRTIMVDGWILARSEARLYALCAAPQVPLRTDA